MGGGGGGQSLVVPPCLHIPAEPTSCRLLTPPNRPALGLNAPRHGPQLKAGQSVVAYVGQVLERGSLDLESVTSVSWRAL